MKAPKNILVVISGKHTKHAALERAFKFADEGNIHIHLFNSIHEPVIELDDVLSSEHRDELKKQYLADRKMYLESLADAITTKGIKCSIHQAWHRNLDQSIVNVVEELQPDLVIKRISADIDSINPFTMPIDRYLLRHCSAPLLLVNSQTWSSLPILAAVDPSSKDSVHIQLNHEVVTAAAMIGKLTNADVHTVNAYMNPTINIPYDIPNLDYGALKTNIEQHYQSKMQTFLSQYNLPNEQIHVIEGEAENAIKNTSDALNAQLVVIGNVGRTGIMASLMGNTAEHILSKLTCEVLAVTATKKK